MRDTGLSEPSGLESLHGDRPTRHRHRLAVVQVGGRRAWDERELIRREPECGRHRVAPRHRRGVPDQDGGDAEQRRALDVQLAGDRRLELVEALGSRPREVRIAEQEAVLVIARARLADGDRVAPGAFGGQLGRELGGDLLGRERRQRTRERHRRRGRLRLGDAGDGDVPARQLDELVEAQVGRHLRDRAHPRLAAARRVRNVGRSADVVQVAVVAVHVAGDRVLRALLESQRRRLGEQLLDHARVDDLLVVEVGVEVVRGDAVGRLEVAAVRPEVARALRVDGHVVLGHRAQVVLGERVSEPVADASVGARLDVRDPVLGAADDRDRRARRGVPARRGESG